MKKLLKSTTVVAVAVLVITLCGCTKGKDKPAIQPTKATNVTTRAKATDKADLIGGWIGKTGEENGAPVDLEGIGYFESFDLNADGTAVYTYGANEDKREKEGEWELKENAVCITFADGEPVTFTVENGKLFRTDFGMKVGFDKK